MRPRAAEWMIAAACNGAGAAVAFGEPDSLTFFVRWVGASIFAFVLLLILHNIDHNLSNCAECHQEREP